MIVKAASSCVVDGAGKDIASRHAASNAFQKGRCVPTAMMPVTLILRERRECNGVNLWVAKLDIRDVFGQIDQSDMFAMLRRGCGIEREFAVIRLLVGASARLE